MLCCCKNSDLMRGFSLGLRVSLVVQLIDGRMSLVDDYNHKKIKFYFLIFSFIVLISRL